MMEGTLIASCKAASAMLLSSFQGGPQVSSSLECRSANMIPADKGL